MAVICREHGLLFLANPLTGSTCIGAVLTDSGMGVQLPTEKQRKALGLKRGQHADVKMLIEAGLLKKKEARQLHKFTGVRNPFDRVTTEYQKLCNVVASGDIPPWMLRNQDKMERIEFVRRDPDFDSFVTKFLGKAKNWSPNGKWADQADSFYRFENLEDDVKKILLDAGVKQPPVFPPFNVTPGKRHYRSYYSDISRAIIERAFAPDLKRFGYEF